MATLEQLRFDNTYARLPPIFHQNVDPTPVPDPYLVAFNPDAAVLIDLDPNEAAKPEFVDYFAGNRLLPGSEPIAMRYAGHQFGMWVPQLGDGRAILLGEVRNARGEKWDLQLKGSGRTMFSRFGDGRAVLRSCIREHLCSEAMHGLGIPTTRALCIIGTDMPVYRESQETGAILLRLSPSHVRFGTFEYFASRDERETLKVLADYTIEQNFPGLRESPDRYRLFFREVVHRTARLIAQWQSVGFAHGVLNTDNMSILGLSIDYGPFGFVEEFNPGFICNHSDETGRYAFDQQARIGYWNLAALGNALTSLVPVEALRETLDEFGPIFNDHAHELMCRKLGLKERREEDRQLWIDLLDVLAEARVDFTNFFRALSRTDFQSVFPAMFAEPRRIRLWLDLYRHRLDLEQSNNAERSERMKHANPKYVLRNYLAQVAIEKATFVRDYSEIERLRQLLARPFDEQPEMEAYTLPAPEWAKGLCVSCSS
jgi:protein adenylyltransferase